MSILFTCDQGGWKTPNRLRMLTDLDHVGPGRATDRAALLAANRLASATHSPLLANESRPDLVDVSRSLHHRDLMLPTVRALSQTTRAAILDEVYHPYRRSIESAVAAALQRHGYLIHLSVRTYEAKTKDGKWRKGDIGLLYDPASQDELEWSLDLVDELYELQPNLKVRRNYPGRGTNDSVTKSLRNRFARSGLFGNRVGFESGLGGSSSTALSIYAG